MAMVHPLRAICIVFYNIFRSLLKKFGILLILACGVFLFQWISNYQRNYDASESSLLLQNGIIHHNNFPSVVTNNTKNTQVSNAIQLNIPKNDVEATEETEGAADTSKEIVRTESKLGIDLPCNITGRDALSAIERATSALCKEKIASVACQIQAGTFYPTRLPSSCPSQGQLRGKHMGCFVDSRENRVLKGHYVNLKEKNSPSVCYDLCYQRGFTYAGVEYSKECFCGNEDLPLPLKTFVSDCTKACSGDPSSICGGFLRINVYQTGLPKYIPLAPRQPKEPLNEKVRIVFVLTVNGRSLRQIQRLFRALYHRDHYFFIHVDSRQDFLYTEMQKLESRYPNVRVSEFRLSTIWGGSSLLSILLHCFRVIIEMKEWYWDFVINLSESDYPIKTNSELVDFLTANRERNFLKSHGHDTSKFMQKQGLDRTFVECDTHMWRVGTRNLPLGIRIDGGSDWLCLNHQFVEYVVNSDDELVTGLKKVFAYTLLPAESFFHTVLRNSELCATFVDNNLHLTNWKRKLGCRCQYKHIVDWCGCSPNDFTIEDWSKLENSKQRNIYFARKFEAAISLSVINQLDAWLYGAFEPDTFGLESHWENIYHHNDRPSGRMDPELTFYNSGSRLSVALLNRMDPQCQVTPTAVLQAHSYHALDEFKGTLIEYSGNFPHDKGNIVHQVIRLETWIFSQVPLPNQFKVNVYDLSGRLKEIEVGGEFDLKEGVFRNCPRLLGPNGDIIVVTRWQALNNITNTETTPQAASVVLWDPVGIIADENVLPVEAGEQILSHTFRLSKPLRPGIWTASVVIGGAVVMTRSFLVMPTQFVHGRQVSVAEARSLHGGPNDSYSEVNLKAYEHLSVHFVHKNNSLWETSVANSKLFGPKLSMWIDEIVGKFHSVVETCYIGTVPVCLASVLEPCNSTLWSSHSPDPKSELGQVGARGRLVEVGRIS